MKTLYIIGNGFDRAHGLETSYWDFRTYLKDNAEEFLENLEHIYGFYPINDDHLFSHYPSPILTLSTFKDYSGYLYNVKIVGTYLYGCSRFPDKVRGTKQKAAALIASSCFLHLYLRGM